MRCIYSNSACDIKLTDFKKQIGLQDCGDFEQRYFKVNLGLQVLAQEESALLLEGKRFGGEFENNFFEFRREVVEALEHDVIETFGCIHHIQKDPWMLGHNR